MTTVTVLIQRCMVILAIFLCYAHADYLNVDCERYPYHHTCRGTMSKRRSMPINTIRALDCDDRNDLDCITLKNYAEKHRRLPLHKSKLWLTLLGDDLQKENAFEVYRPKYGAHHEKRKNEDFEMYDDRRIPMAVQFPPEMELSENDY